eukprot:3568870-Pyramimonas_sp.AAC.1
MGSARYSNGPAVGSASLCRCTFSLRLATRRSPSICEPSLIRRLRPRPLSVRRSRLLRDW